MRAFVLTGPRTGAVQQVKAPVPGPDQVLLDVHRVGVCGTDVEFFTGEMAYLHQGHAEYPLRLGHEWCGVVSDVAAGVDPVWIGQRVTGDTMLGCGRCPRCQAGRHNVCADRVEIGIRGGFAGALAEQLVVPVGALLALPETVNDTAGAMVEPGGNALRAVRAAELAAGERVLIFGTGTIGLLAAAFARAAGAQVHLLGEPGPGLRFAAEQGFAGAWTLAELPELRWDAVIDASNAPGLPALALELVEPGRRVVYIGLAGVPSAIDTRTMVLKDVTAVGILAASAGLAGAVDAYATGALDPGPLVAATVSLDEVADVLAGVRPDRSGPGPKLHVDPRR